VLVNKSGRSLSPDDLFSGQRYDVWFHIASGTMETEGVFTDVFVDQWISKQGAYTLEFLNCTVEWYDCSWISAAQ
jgi:hypothetical protein